MSFGRLMDCEKEQFNITLKKRVLTFWSGEFTSHL